MANAKVKSEPEDRKYREAYGMQSADHEKHLEWVRDHPRRLREAESKGFEYAKREDMGERSDRGVTMPDERVRDGDLILMKHSRAEIERRRDEEAEQRRSQDKTVSEKFDRENELITRQGHGQRSGGRFYSIP